MARELNTERLAKLTAKYRPRIVVDPSPHGGIVIISEPVFLSYTTTSGGLFTPKIDESKVDRDGNPKSTYGCTVLFQSGSDLSVYYKVQSDLMKKNEVMQDEDGQWLGVQIPIKSQTELGTNKQTGKLRPGYVKGAFGMRVSTNRKPLIHKYVGGKEVIVDKPEFDVMYDGVLALVATNPYWYPKDKRDAKDPKVKKGVGFGLTRIAILDSNTPKWFEPKSSVPDIDKYGGFGLSKEDIVAFDSEDGADMFGDEYEEDAVF